MYVELLVSARLDFERDNYHHKITRRFATDLHVSTENREKVSGFNTEQNYEVFFFLGRDRPPKVSKKRYNKV